MFPRGLKRGYESSDLGRSQACVVWVPKKATNHYVSRELEKTKSGQSVEEAVSCRHLSGRNCSGGGEEKGVLFKSLVKEPPEPGKTRSCCNVAPDPTSDRSHTSGQRKNI